MKFIKILLITIITTLISNIALAYTIEGKIIYVYDGDTVLLEQNIHSTTPQSLRASSPIRGALPAKQPCTLIRGASPAKQPCTLIRGALPAKQPCTLIRGALVDISSIMLANGAAWHYKAFDKTSVQYDLHYALEHQAKANKRGLWAHPNPIAPWIWRKEH